MFGNRGRGFTRRTARGPSESRPSMAAARRGPARAAPAEPLPAVAQAEWCLRGAPWSRETHYSLRGSNPQPITDKTIALTAELREHSSQDGHMLTRHMIYQARESGAISLSLSLFSRFRLLGPRRPCLFSAMLGRTPGFELR